MFVCFLFQKTKKYEYIILVYPFNYIYLYLFDNAVFITSYFFLYMVEYS